MPDIQLNDDKIYAQLCDDIRKTDDISFKLLGLVPLVSGAGGPVRIAKRYSKDALIK